MDLLLQEQCKLIYMALELGIDEFQGFYLAEPSSEIF
jgi:EAL domain-containing protein (putative c-di-GMP-specific phosphodiesterase class I)